MDYTKKIPSFLRVAMAICVVFTFCCNALAQKNDGIVINKGKLIRITPKIIYLDKNTKGPLYKQTRNFNGLIGIDDEEIQVHKHYPSINTSSRDRALQTSSFTSSGVNSLSGNIISNFDGMGFSGVTPSDNVIAAGPNHVVQMINNSTSSFIKIWDKAGTQIQAPILLSSITGVTGSGDPIVIYDQLADRFVLTEFGESAGVTTYPNTLIMAVSATPDPTGSWKVYSFPNTGFFADYPKFAVWHNAYYATTNDFNTSGTAYFGSTAYAFDKAAMIAGAPTATVISQRFVDDEAGRYYTMCPVTVEGTTTSSQSGLFAFIQDDAWTSTPNDVDSIFVMEFTPDFTNPSLSFFTNPFSIATIPFNSNVQDLSQKGSAQTLDALSERLMFKVIYRNFGDHESIVCNTTVNVGLNRAGIRWWELRKPAANWGIYQEGTFAPGTDVNHRFMGAICINPSGNIGLLYNVSGSTSFPSLWFTARTSCDSLGILTLPETVVINGTAANNNVRYGDYNTLTIDPVNGSFWGTGQYNKTGSWSTRLVNLSLSGGGTITLTNQPAIFSTCAGGTASFSVSVVSSPASTYQWQVSIDSGKSYTDIAGATSAIYSFTASAGENGYKYRAVINGACLVNSNAAALIITDAAIANNGQPKNVSACLGTDVTLKATATGSGLKYQWQVSTDSMIYNDVPGATSDSLLLPGITAGIKDNLYRVVVSGDCNTIFSKTANVQVNFPVTISTDGQPVNAEICSPNNTGFTVNAGGTGAVYQWQVSKDGGASFLDIPGAVFNRLDLISPTSQMSSYLYRAFVKGLCTPGGLSSAIVSLTVNDPVKIIIQPADTAACDGTTTEFKIASTASGVTTYQWQVKENGIGFVDLFDNPTYLGVNTAKLTVSNVNLLFNGSLYRVKVFNSMCGDVVSTPAVLTVNPLPSVLLKSSATSIAPGLSAILSTDISPAGSYSYQWYRNGVLVPTITSASFTTSVDEEGIYEVTITDAKGCSSKKSNAINISDFASTRLFVYPNPSSGSFQVRYYNAGDLASPIARTITIYSANGGRIFTKLFPVIARYDKMSVNIPNAQSGVYFIDLRDNKGRRIATGKIIIQ